MALVHHQMPVAGHNVVHNVAAFKALELSWRRSADGLLNSVASAASLKGSGSVARNSHSCRDAQEVGDAHPQRPCRWQLLWEHVAVHTRSRTNSPTAPTTSPAKASP